MPTVTLDPRLVLVAILPPLLYAGAYFTSLREVRANIAEISLLAVGLVLATMIVVAAVAHALIPGLDWPTAFVLGAIVSPTDPTVGDRDRRARRAPTAPGRDHRRREPRERRHRARRVPLRGCRRRHRLVLAGHRARPLRRQRRRRDRASASPRATSCAGCAGASTTRRSSSRSRSAAATSPTSPPRRPASPACSPPSRSASTWAGTRPS